MPINCSRSERESASFTLGVVVRRNDVHETAVKGNNDGRWSSDDVVLCLGRKQNGDVVEW
jgi:hypothetical protein